jgi:hypothetical protein
MDVVTRGLLQGLGTEILEQKYPDLVILRGGVIAISNDELELYEKDAISWTTVNAVANFIGIQDSPFLVADYGTVQLVDEPFPIIVPIQYDGCKVSFNHAFWKKYKRNKDYVINYYQIQLNAKIRAYDELLAQVILFGNPSRGIPGMLNGSGIPIISSTINLSTAPGDQVITEVVTMLNYVANATQNTYRPTLISFPQDLVNLLINRRYSVNDATSLWTLIKQAVSESPGFETVTPEYTAVPQFNTNKIGAVLPSDPKEIGAVVFPLEEFYSPDDSESREGDNNSEGFLASAHEGGYAGVVARRAEAGVIIQWLY